MILVVDDSRTIRWLVSDALLAAGFDVTAACDGLEALKRISEVPRLELIVCDVNIGGVKFLQALRTTPLRARIPVVVLTTRGELDLRHEARELGVHAWVFKPFDPKLLIEAVRSAIVPRAKRSGTYPVACQPSA